MFDYSVNALDIIVWHFKNKFKLCLKIRDENFIKFYHFKKKHHFVILLLLPRCSKAAKQLLDSQLTDQNRIGNKV